MEISLENLYVDTGAYRVKGDTFKASEDIAPPSRES